MDINQAKAIAENTLKNATGRNLNQTLFGMANAYNEAGHNALAQIESTKNANFAGPAIMNYSFSIELLLKLLVVLDGNFDNFQDLPDKKILKGHRYSELFDKIPVAHQTRVATAFSENTKSTKSASDFRSELIQIGDDPFVQWRYIYETSGNSHMNFELMRSIMDALGKTASEILEERRVGT